MRESTSPPLTRLNFFEVVLEKVPAFRDVYEEHVQENETVLAHLLMGDLMRFVVKTYREFRLGRRKDAIQETNLKTCLCLLEEAIVSDDEGLQELVSVSFLENLHQAEGDYEGIRSMLGPNLVRELHAHYE